MSEWISVKDRLPECECDVIANYYFDRGLDSDKKRNFVGSVHFYANDVEPHFQHRGMGLTVTHWMPLPEPPEQE